AALAIELSSLEYSARQLAMPKAVSEEMFPPELLDSEPPAVRPGETPLAVPAPVAREVEPQLVAALAHAEWADRSLALSMPVVEFVSGLRTGELAAAKSPELAEVVPGPRGVAEAIDMTPAAVIPALS